MNCLVLQPNSFYRKIKLINLIKMKTGLRLLSILVFSGIVYTLIDTNSAMLAFLALPLIYGLLNFFRDVTESLYIWFYQTYGVDVLNIETRYGSDFDDELQEKNK